MTTSDPSPPRHLSALAEAWRSFLHGLRKDSAPSSLVARNFLLDEGPSVERANSYLEAGGAKDHGEYGSWLGAHNDYLHERIFRPHSGEGSLDPEDPETCPETFRSLDPGGPFLAIGRGEYLIRVERIADLERVLSHSERATLGPTLEAQSAGRASEAERRWLGAVLAKWHETKEMRPTFSGLLMDLAHLFGPSAGSDPAGWADELRDSLGLLHLDPESRRRPLPIVVFRFKVNDVPRLRGRKGQAPLVPPSVLDGRHSEAFCPSPQHQATGHIVHLSKESEPLRREVLHPTVPFRCEHVFRCGVVTRQVDRSTLRLARAFHLLELRKACGRDDYGEDTDGDLF